MWKRSTMLALPLALLSGCARIEFADTYCDVAEVHQFGGEETISWLLRNDRDLLVSIVVHNETRKRLCAE